MAALFAQFTKTLTTEKLPSENLYQNINLTMTETYSEKLTKK